MFAEDTKGEFGFRLPCSNQFAATRPVSFGAFFQGGVATFRSGELGLRSTDVPKFSNGPGGIDEAPESGSMAKWMPGGMPGGMRRIDEAQPPRWNPPATYVGTYARKGTRRRDLQSLQPRLALSAVVLATTRSVDAAGFCLFVRLPLLRRNPPEQKACGRRENSGDRKPERKKRSRAAFLKRAARSLAEPNAHRQCTEVRIRTTHRHTQTRTHTHTCTAFCMHGTCANPRHAAFRSRRPRWRIFTWPGKPGQAPRTMIPLSTPLMHATLESSKLEPAKCVSAQAPAVFGSISG